MNRNPYGCTGPCRACGRSPATSRCQAMGQPETQLCNACTPAFWSRVHDWLERRGILAVGAT